MTETMYTLQEAAELLRMPYRSLRDAVYSGRWPHRKISQRRRFMTEEDIRAVMEMTLQPPVPPRSPSADRQTRKRVLALLNTGS